MGLFRTGQFLPTYVGRIERAIARTTPARVFQAEFARSFYRTAERRTRLLDLRQQLLPVRERVSESVEDVFCLKVPERLELQPFSDVVLE